MTLADEIFEDGFVPVEGDLSPFAGAEDDNPESHMDAQEVE